jgi:hypothetical protein
MRAAETVSPSPGGEGRGEGGLQTKIELHYLHPFYREETPQFFMSSQLRERRGLKGMAQTSATLPDKPGRQPPAGGAGWYF